ncbi:MAG: aspartate--tRNA ligase [Deltaproteobacteria bacterium]|nr:aspartate--tRNA ligase [Deltaproteobacteria bacterium]
MAQFIEELKKSHGAGELRLSHKGEQVVLMGWVDTVRDLGGTLFIDLRDRSGICQVVLGSEQLNDLQLEVARSLRQEYVVAIMGDVIARGGKPNTNLKTGEIEVLAKDVALLNRSQPMPFQIADNVDTGEEVRLKYRFLDLRRAPLQKALLMRSKAALIAREHFASENFIEVETPILTKSTPEGARDYLVPSRINKGKFFALPQSPQLFKQLLQVAGFERYFQICKCFRDEDLRADRQPEFTQIDLEMSFVTPDDIMAVCDGMLQKMFKHILNVDIETPIPRITYDEAMARYGVDNPDVRFGMELFDITEDTRDSAFKVFSGPATGGGLVTGIVVAGGASFSRKDVDALTEFVKTYGAKGLAWLKRNDGAFSGPVSKFVDVALEKALLEKAAMKDGDIALIVADMDASVARTAAGRLRTHVAKSQGMVNPGQFGFTWVTDFPMFEKDEETGKLAAMHHPFTSPRPEDVSMLSTDPLKVKTRAYDIVLNGQEIGGGSIRIHNQDVQAEVFKALGIGDEEARNKFGFLLDALSFGAPPHGGLAFGFDRLVSIMSGLDSIRDVIAFPKTTRAGCLMTDAPSEVDDKQLTELGIKRLD